MVYRAALATGEPEMYYSKFVMFQMGDFSELHAMCNVRLCITNAEAACDTQSPVRNTLSIDEHFLIIQDIVFPGHLFKTR